MLYGSNLWYIGEGLFGPLVAIFTQRIGGDLLDVSWAWATYMIVTGILVIIVGKISDRFDKRKILVSGYFLNALFTFAYLFVNTPYQLIMVQAGLGLAAAMAVPTWDALYSEYEDGDANDGWVWGLARGEAQIVTGIAIILGGFIVTYTSFNVLFIIMGIIQLIAATYQSLILRNNGHD